MPKKDRNILQPSNSIVGKDPNFHPEIKLTKVEAMTEVYGENSPVNTLSAIFLAGAAIVIPDLPVIRKDLDISLRDARDQYQKQIEKPVVKSNVGKEVQNRGGVYKEQSKEDPFIRDLATIFFNTLSKW